MEFIYFLLVFLGLDIVMNVLTKSFVKMLGFDLLFLGSWLAGVEFGAGPGLLVSVLLLAEHTVFFLQKGNLILFSFPAQFTAVMMGNLLGFNYFLVSLLIYQSLNVLIMWALKALGPRFILFLVFNTVFSILAFKIIAALI